MEQFHSHRTTPKNRNNEEKKNIRTKNNYSQNYSGIRLRKTIISILEIDMKNNFENKRALNSTKKNIQVNCFGLISSTTST